MKKGSYWFSKLSEQEQVEFKLNAQIGLSLHWESFEDYLEAKFESFFKFIVGAFSWTRTKEGLDYWLEISQRVVE